MKLKIFLLFFMFKSLAFAEKIDKYDIHQHYIPEPYRQALLRHGVKGFESDGLPTPAYNVEEQLKTMDDLGIKFAYISIASPHPYWGNKSETIKLVRQINDDGAKIVSKYPDRFGLFATLPLPDVKGSISEINYVYDTLGVNAIKLPTNVDGIYLGDEKFDPIFNELNKRKAIVILHPVQFATVPDSILKNYPPAIALYLQETTFAVLNLIYSGTLEKYPDIKIVIPHGGSLLPALYDRLIGFQGLVQSKTKYKLGDIKEQLGKFYYDLAGFSVPNQLYGLKNMVDITHLLYGSDYPYAFPNFIKEQKEKLDKTKLLNRKQKQQIYRDNFEILFNKKK